MYACNAYENPQVSSPHATHPTPTREHDANSQSAHSPAGPLEPLVRRRSGPHTLTTRDPNAPRPQLGSTHSPHLSASHTVHEPRYPLHSCAPVVGAGSYARAARRPPPARARMCGLSLAAVSRARRALCPYSLSLSLSHWRRALTYLLLRRLHPPTRARCGLEALPTLEASFHLGWFRIRA